MTDSISKIGAMLESARELTLEAASSASARLMDDTPPKPRDITALLNSRSERDHINGMKHIVTIMGKGGDASEFFPEVVKNIASSNLEVRKLVYGYLIQYAQDEPDLALLSINTIQKSLSNQNPFVRSLALRVMSSIRVPVIVPIVILAVRQSIRDPSAIVRRASVEALGHCIEMDPSAISVGTELLPISLKDNDPEVCGSALVVLSKHMSDRLDMLHVIYRRICKTVCDMDEWRQIIALDLLLRYARQYLPEPKPNGPLDGDLILLFEQASLLLYSNNSAVVIAVSKLYFYLGDEEIFKKYNVASFTTRLLRGENAVKQIALLNIRNMALQYPQAFSSSITSFVVFPTDSSVVASLKLDMLTLLADETNISFVLSELRTYATLFEDRRIIVDSIQAMAFAALGINTKWKSKVVKWLLHQIKGENRVLISESLTALRYLVQNEATNHRKTLVSIAKTLENGKDSHAKATIIWIVGENAHLLPDIAIDVLRKCVRTFPEDAEDVRYQTVLLASKLYSRYLDTQASENDNSGSSQIVPLYDYVIRMAKYDSSYDTRDRTRMFSSLLSSTLNKEIASLILQAPKPSSAVSLKEKLLGLDAYGNIPDKSVMRGRMVLGTSSLVVGHALDGYQSLPSWTPVDDLDMSLRDEAIDDHTYNRDFKVHGSSSNPTAITNTAAKNGSHAAVFRRPDNHGVPTAPTQRLKEQSLEEFLADVPSVKSHMESESDEDEDDESEYESTSDEEDSSEDEEEEEEEEEDGLISDDAS